MSSKDGRTHDCLARRVPRDENGMASAGLGGAKPIFEPNQMIGLWTGQFLKLGFFQNRLWCGLLGFMFITKSN